MNRDENRIAHIQFQLEIYKRDAQAYEDFFTHVMSLHNPNFMPVKPYGNTGDRKNDGFDKTTGTYYQVYAPEDLSKRQGEALAKLYKDFTGLLEFWQDISPVKHFYFVLNDKYKGTFPDLEKALAELEKSFNVRCNSFLNRHLENTFETLSDEKKLLIIGHIPNPNFITSVDYSTLREVVGHLMSLKAPKFKETRPIQPDFVKKIELNGLSEFTASFLKIGSYQTGEVEEYFKRRSDFTKEDLRQRFVTLYNEGLETIVDSPDKNDEVFFYIMEKSKPRDEAVYDTPVAVLMAYYFEYCDIFKVPE